MQRRTFLTGTLAALATSSLAEASQDGGADFPIEEATIDDLQGAMWAGRVSATQLAERYLQRIAALNPKLRAVLELNPDALRIAAGVDSSKPGGLVVGAFHVPRPLLGIPVLLKDNVDTADKMATSAGSLALLGDVPVSDAFVVKRLRAQGAVILGKTNLSEWANFRSTRASSGWSGRGGQTRNPYALDRTPSGSSSGSGAAVAANLCAVGIGTETDGSITAPASVMGLVGLKPTVGLVSRTGIIPIASSQDTAGPMTRTVRDAAYVLTAIAGVDPEDPATAKAPLLDYTGGLNEATLKGARLGVVRKLFPNHPEALALTEKALAALKDRGAVLIDPVELPGGYDDAEMDVLLYEFKAGLNAYLAKRRPNAKVKSLKELIAFNQEHAETELSLFDQDIFERAEKKGPLTDATYLKAVRRCRELSAKAIDALVAKQKLDAFIAPTCDPAFVIDPVYGDRPQIGYSTTPAAVAGYPSLTVPMGQVRGLPVGLSFFGPAFSEMRLFQLGYAFEQATHHRAPPVL